MSLLQKIQSELKAPKSQYNKFGNYPYRSLEDIMEALKPILSKHGASVVISDKIVEISGRFYVEARATLFDSEMKEVAHNTASAREQEKKKGMDEAQITGSTSSYARKYACNGLFLIDDTKDPDSMDNSKQPKKEEDVPNYPADADMAEAYTELMTEIDKCPSKKMLDEWGELNDKRIKNQLSGNYLTKLRNYFKQVKDILPE